ncbi:universal stress protein [Gordonia sp. KTR9]|uniref:universal stress protein n=1 Tax=Gordonia sp. KTR9 TaxID=337191 RepID=UPI00027DE458|nr:universal stress protein [Gordonia sp. KTR9]AFR51451.1 hypothetical protein KTR9_4992 [Gordonia sp. KTR9]
MTDHHHHQTDPTDPPPREKLRDWRSPLYVDGPSAGEPDCHLVVGFDRHPASHTALTYAINLAARLDGYLHVAHIVDNDDLPIDPDSDDWEQRIADAVESERVDACTILAESRGNWTYYSREGTPSHLLTAIADANDALMIVIGASRGGVMSLMERFLGESVSSALVHHARRPVLLVPAAH